MDNGAHFYRCDLQVHSPRDLAWSGKRPETQEERIAFADRFIAACRQRGIDAVAITDHHDTVFFRYIKDAAQREIDENGKPVPEDKRIIVFPGMELTLGVPCQALLILDADFPVDFLGQVVAALSINPPDPSVVKHPQPQRLEHFSTLSELCDEFDKREYLKGRYIVLPNVSEGKFSLLRSGFASKYKEMPCVGGYVDGSASKLGEGNKKILNGENKEYGNKVVAIVQTSDSRRDDFETLGDTCSWIKFAVPTAEALRQACLAHRTRIFNEQPVLPAVDITRLEVSNSKFLGPINLDFNPQLNCFIGGRGTGKSTLLEYLRWALCDQPPSFNDEEEIPDFQKKRASLIVNTLLPFDAVVTVSFSLNGILHSVRRYARTKQLLLKIANEEYAECHEDTIRDLLGVQAYSQKQLSTVGVRIEELVRFIRTPIAKQLHDFELRVEELKGQIRRTYGQIQEKRLLSREITKESIEVESLKQQLETLQKALKGLAPEDREVLAQHSGFLEEEKQTNDALAMTKEWQAEIQAAIGALRPPRSPSAIVTPNKDLIDSLGTQLMALHGSLAVKLREALALLDTSSDAVIELDKTIASWRAKFGVHSEQYTAAKGRATAHEAHLKQIAQVEGRLRSIQHAIGEKQRRLEKYGNPEDNYNRLRNDWDALYGKRADALEDRCSKLTALSHNRIRARLRRGGGLENFKSAIARATVGSRLRAKKLDELCDYVAAASDPVFEWQNICRELESLAALDKSEETELHLPACPTLRKAGFATADIDRLAHVLTTESWLELSLVELEDLPVFEYRQGETDYIPFAEASAGQQATALLRVLLHQDGPPLVIDQPEEDLDNPVILEIVEEIWNAKSRRQLIFSSHNANIVVNGDADLVVCCDYRTAGDQSGGKIKAKGAIDIPAIRGEITTVMEGGKEAFRLRKEKYGF